MAYSFWTEIEVANPTDTAKVFTIPKGRLLSPKNLSSKVQNLVVTEETTVTVPPKGKTIVTIPTDCTDPSYNGPSNTPMDVTTFGQKERQDNVFPGRSM